MVAAALLPSTSFGVTDSTSLKAANATMKSVQFSNSSIKTAGNLVVPKGFKATAKYPAVVCVRPGGGVKEQTAGLYAQQLAEQGSVTFAFDASHQGVSGGMARFLDDPMRRVGDMYTAVDYMMSLPYVDASCIGALSICAGSGAAVKAASTIDASRQSTP